MALNEVTAAVKVGGALYRNKNVFFELMTKAVIKYKNTDIVITGASGAGKSHLVEYIQSEIKAKKQHSPDVSATVEHSIIRLNDDWIPKKISVIPGQAFLAREKAFIDLVSDNSKLKGIIHVVDWGFTKPKMKDFEAYIKGQNIDTIDALREENLREEINYLNSLADAIEKKGEEINWFVIVLNKIDLFNQGDAVKYYHSDEKFNAALNRVLSKVKNVGQKRNLVQPFCCLRENFTFNNDCVKTNLGNQKEQLEYLTDFLKAIELNLAE